MKRLLLIFLLLAGSAFAQTSVSLMPNPCPQFTDSQGRPLSGGRVFTYSAGTSTPQAAYVDSAGTIAHSNPIVLNSAGRPMVPSGSACGIWLSLNAYRIVVQNSSGVQQWVVDGVSDPGFFYTTRAVLLNPAGGILQTITGPLAATSFQGTTLHITSTGIRVSYLDPDTILDTASNPPHLKTMTPAAANHNYRIPDPGGHANFVLSPDPNEAGANVLDCTATGITCKRKAFFYLEGGGCNNTSAGMGWDTFPTNSPTPFCVTGTNIQKGVLAFPSAATPLQTATCTGTGSTCEVTMPAATTAHSLLTMGCVVDTSRTISGVTDGTNVYGQAVGKTNGTLDVELWYFDGDSASATGTVTVTFSGAGNSACRWREYAGLEVASVLDQTASASNTGTAVSTGTTTGTAQNTELVLAIVGSVANPSVTGASGWSQHGTVSQSTNVTFDSEAKIQQATSTQTADFTLGSSQVYAAAIATFKADVGSQVTAQRHIALPARFRATDPVNATVKWYTPQAPTGTVNTVLNAAVVCTDDGSTDDPVFNTATSSTEAISATGPVVTSTAFEDLDASDCAAGGLMHVKVGRDRYNAADTFEGWVYMLGTALDFGISQ